MKTDSFQQRVKALTIEGLRVGAKYFFLFSLFLEFSLSIIFVKSIFSEINKISNISSIPYLIGFIILINFTFWLFGVIPITTVGIVGIALVLLANYLYWLMRSTNFHNHYSFLSYLLPLSIPKEISQYFLFVNPYFIPSVVSVLLWAGAG